jgi:hypothetical protein
VRYAAALTPPRRIASRSMDQKFIPDDVAQFVTDKIDSVAELEALLLLRNAPEREWTARELSQRLYLSVKDAVDILAALSAKGLALCKAGDPGAYKYQPGLPEVGKMIDRLCDIYAKQIVPVTNLIHSKSKTRVQEFADAFKLRKKGD